MKTHKAILIDPATRQITMIELEDRNEEILRLLDCEDWGFHYYPCSNTAFLLDNARITRPNDPSFEFAYTNEVRVNIIGRALIISCTSKGNLTDVFPGIADVFKRIRFNQ